jgi:hypothetical protein
MKPLKLLLGIFIMLLTAQVVCAEDTQGLTVTATCVDGSTLQTQYDNSQLDIQFNNNGQEHFILVSLPANYINAVFLPYSERTRSNEPQLGFEQERLNGMNIYTSIIIHPSSQDLNFLFKSEATRDWSLFNISMGKTSKVQGEIHLYFMNDKNSVRPLKFITVHEKYFDINQNKELEVHLQCNVIN